MKYEFFIIYNILILCFGLILFLNGYFPMTKCHTNEIQHKPNVQRKIHRTVLMVVDAMREDLINCTGCMPFLNSLYDSDNSCYFSTKVEVPTVTLPRLKALTTGVIPNFIDVLTNFESEELNIDNILKLAVDNGQKIVFYGDEVWLKMFPKTFTRSDGTSSFYVTDYTEVDNNVTRHLKFELAMEDWDIMILHYLGLDHIGHLEGPRGHLMRPKLYEMDSIIKQIYQSLKIWEAKTKQKSLFLVSSDHGMDDNRGHGGSTTEEVNVPLISLGVPCSSESIEQIDLAPTLSPLLGLSFPASSIGKLIPGLLTNIYSKNDLLLVFKSYYNHLVDLLKVSTSANIYKETEEGLKNFLSNKNKNWDENKIFSYSYSFYKTEIDRISKYFIESRTVFDIYSLLIALVLLWTTSLVFLINHSIGAEFSLYKRIPFSISTLAILNLSHLIYCSFCNADYCSDLCSMDKWPVIFLASLILSVNINYITHHRPKITLLNNAFLGWVAVCQLIQIITLSSNSFIEQEQHTWNFYVSAAIFYILYNGVTRNSSKMNLRNLLECIILACLFRIVRELNVTWLDIETDNISLWLYSNIYLISVSFIIGLVLVSIACKILFNPNKLTYILLNLNLILIYLYRGATGIVLSPMSLSNERGHLEAWLAYICIPVVALSYFVFKTKKWKNKKFFIESVTLFWILLISLLLRPHNLILIFVLFFASKKIFDNESNSTILILLHFWLGKEFYFLQGTTNNIASIEVSSGYIGQTTYNPFLVGLLITVHTYSMPILAHLLLLVNFNKHFSNLKIRSFANELYFLYLLITFVGISYYCTIMLILRSHLFTWSVFSPKLMFDSVYAFTVILCILCTEIIFVRPLIK